MLSALADLRQHSAHGSATDLHVGVSEGFSHSDSPVTEWLREWQRQEGATRIDARLLDVVYAELKRIARQRLARESLSPLTPTELVHETWMRLRPSDSTFADRHAFLKLASTAMRHYLVDQARERLAGKRAAGAHVTTLSFAADAKGDRFDDVRLIDLDQAMERLAIDHPRAAEAISLRAFGGLNLDELASAMQVSLATAKRDLAFGRAWLGAALETDRG